MGHNEFLSALCTIMTAVDFSQLLFIFFLQMELFLLSFRR